MKNNDLCTPLPQSIFNPSQVSRPCRSCDSRFIAVTRQEASIHKPVIAVSLSLGCVWAPSPPVAEAITPRRRKWKRRRRNTTKTCASTTPTSHARRPRRLLHPSLLLPHPGNTRTPCALGCWRSGPSPAAISAGPTRCCLVPLSEGLITKSGAWRRARFVFQVAWAYCRTVFLKVVTISPATAG